MSAALKMEPTPQDKLEGIVQRVKEASAAWVKVSLEEKIRLLEDLRQGYRAVAEDSVRAACQAKGLDFDAPVSGEEWLGGPMVTIRNLRLLAQALREVQRHGVPRIDPAWIKDLPDGRIAVRVYPTDAMEGMILAKHEAWVHMQEGVTRENLRDHQASFYKKPHAGRVCVVLGAGNVNAIPPTDVLYKLFVEGTCCILKMNPVNEYLGPFIERAFKPLIDKGFLAVVYGGAEVGKALVEHPLADEIHITGSDKTHDLMIWGPPGPEQDARKQRNDPALKKAITSELGNVTPVIVVPGPYSDAELQFQADNIAGMVTNNASFNCNAAKLLVDPAGWPMRDELLAAIERGIQKSAARKAYYPGAADRFKQFTEGRKGLKLLGNPGPGELPWALIPEVDPNDAQDRVFSHEPWCSILSETRLPGGDAKAFLEAVVPFVNEKVWGTLACTLVVHPRTLKDPVQGPAVEKAIRELRYGSVVVNTWAGAVFGLGTTPWGGHPSSTLANIQSGVGWVHNTFMLEDIEKCVLAAPVKAFPISPWFPGHRTQSALAKKLVDFEMNPSWLKIPGIATTAMKA